MTNKSHERALRLVLNDHVNDFGALLRTTNNTSYHYRNIQMLMIDISKIKNELAPPIMDSMLNGRNIIYNFRNLQEFQSERKTRTLMVQKPYATVHPMDTLARNTINLFKSDVKQWICKKRPSRLRKVFVANLGFI